MYTRRTTNARQSLKQSNNTQTIVRIIIIASLPGSQGEVSELRRNAINLDWMFLSNHAHILICIGQEPEVRLREVAARVGITERAVQRIVADLEERRYLARARAALQSLRAARGSTVPPLGSRAPRRKLALDRDQARWPRLDSVSTGLPFGFRGHPKISVRGFRVRCAAPRAAFSDSPNPR